MTAWQFVKPWLSLQTGDQADAAFEFANLRKYLKGLDDGTIPFFNLNLLNATISNLTVAGNIAMGGFKLTGLGAGSTNGDSLRYEQLIGLYLLLTGGTMSGAIAMGSNKITGLTNGTASGDVVNFGQYQQATTNILDNGGFEGYGWQRGTSFSNPATGAYVADRWKVNTNEASTVTVTKETTTIDSVGLSSMKVVTTGSGASKAWAIEQYIENVADYRGRTLTFSVRVNSNIASAIRVELFDNVSGDITSSYHTGGSTWETLSGTMTVAATATNIRLSIGMLGAGDKKNGTYYFDSAMVVGGSEAVAFVGTNPDIDLNKCMRNFQVMGGSVTNEFILVGQATTTSNAYFMYILPVPMRVAPTATVNNATNFTTTRANGVTDAVSAMSFAGVGTLTPKGVSFNTTSANLVAGNATTLSTQNTNASVYLSADF